MRIKIDRQQVERTFGEFKDNGSFQESAQLFAQGRPVLEMLQAMAINPNVLAAFSGLDRIYPHGSLERPLMERVILYVSRLHQCQFCASSHADIAAALGIAANPSEAERSPRERAAVEYAEQITRDSNRVSDELFGRVQAVFSDAEIVELTFLIGLITLLNRFNNALGVRYNGEMAAVQVR